MALLAGHERLPTVDAAPYAYRAITPADVGDLFAIFGDPEAMRYWSHTAFADLDAARDYQRQIQQGFDERTLFQWGLVRKDEDRVIGTTTLCNFEHRRAEVGYALARSEWGSGVMSRALPVLLRFAFDEFDLHRIEADVDPRNPASFRLLERLGFKKEGYRREAYFVGDEIQDAVIYGLLKREFAGGTG